MRLNIKKISIFAFLLTTLLLTGCKGKKSKTTENKSQTTSRVATKSHTHEFGEWKIIETSTCSTHGSKKRVCSCGEYEIEDLPLLDHTFENDKCVDCGFERLTDGFVVEYVSNQYSLEDFENAYHIRGYIGTSKTVRIPKFYDDGVHGVCKLIIDNDVENENISILANSIIEKIYVGEDYGIVPTKFLVGLVNLKEVVLPKTCTTISDCAFMDCSNLSTVSFNQGLETIKSNAFKGCNFTKLTFPSSLRSILLNSFSSNKNLAQVTFNDGLDIIDCNAFYDTKISSLELPKSISYFGYEEKMPYLESISISGINDTYEVANNCLIEKESNTIIKGTVTSTIPSNVTRIGTYSFSNIDFSNLTKFVIPENIETILFDAFSGSTFNDMEIKAVVTIEDEAFKGIIFNNYETYELVLPNTVTTIGKNAFDRAYFNKIVIPESVTTVGSAIVNKSMIMDLSIYQTTLDSVYVSTNWNVGINENANITIID